MSSDAGRLTSFSKEEWWDLMSRLKPTLTRDRFDELWEDFQAMKRERQNKRAVN